MTKVEDGTADPRSEEEQLEALLTSRPWIAEWMEAYRIETENAPYYSRARMYELRGESVNPQTYVSKRFFEALNIDELKVEEKDSMKLIPSKGGVLFSEAYFKRILLRMDEKGELATTLHHHVQTQMEQKLKTKRGAKMASTARTILPEGEDIYISSTGKHTH